MESPYLRPGGNRDPREVDRLASKTRSLWGKTYVFIKKANIKSWKRIFALAFITGAVAATVWTISAKIISLIHSAGETAALELVASSDTVTVGETFAIDLIVNTNLNKVVVTKAVVSYNPQYFELVSWDTAGSAFAAGNTCQYQGKACEIVNNDAANGKISITVGKPTPGVSSATANIGKLNFKALKSVTPTASNVNLSYTSGSYDDSDVIFDDGKGTDILNKVINETVTIKAPIVSTTPVVDAQATKYPTSSYFTAYQERGESFVAGLSGKLHSITLRRHANGSSAKMYFKVGSSTDLRSGKQFNCTVPTGAGDFECVIPEADRPLLAAGSKYHFLFRAINTSQPSWQISRDTSNTNYGGTPYFDDSYLDWKATNGTMDLYFKTKMYK